MSDHSEIRDRQTDRVRLRDRDREFYRKSSHNFLCMWIIIKVMFLVSLFFHHYYYYYYFCYVAARLYLFSTFVSNFAVFFSYSSTLCFVCNVWRQYDWGKNEVSFSHWQMWPSTFSNTLCTLYRWQTRATWTRWSMKHVNCVCEFAKSTSRWWLQNSSNLCDIFNDHHAKTIFFRNECVHSDFASFLFIHFHVHVRNSRTRTYASSTHTHTYTTEK